jgi:trimethylamine---corrinoid protein Co-methyltransferase
MTDTTEILELIHNASLELLQSPGIRLYDKKILEKLKKRGVRVDNDIAMFSEKQVTQSLSSTPCSFTLNAINPDKSLVIGGNNRCMAGSFGPPLIVTSDHQKRLATFEDYIRVTRLVHATDLIHINGGTLVQPNDIEMETSKLLMTRAVLALSDKPLLGFQGGHKELSQIIKLAAIAFGGEDYFRLKPHMLFLVSTFSPLQIDSEALATIDICARYGQPLIITPAPITGSTGPITAEGALVQANTEFLATLCIIQMITPGLPVVYGCLSGQGDMRTGGVNIASPSSSVFMRLASQMADKYNLPKRAQGVITDAAQVSFQSAYESLFTLNYTYINQNNLTIHSAGCLASYASFSYEQFMIDLELIRLMECAHRECNFSKDNLAIDAIRQVGHGGTFLTHAHTLKHCRTDTFVPQLAPVKNDDPQKFLADIESNVKKRLTELEQAYQKPDLDKGVQKDMDNYAAACGIPSMHLDNIL